MIIYILIGLIVVLGIVFFVLKKKGGKGQEITETPTETPSEPTPPETPPTPEQPTSFNQ